MYPELTYDYHMHSNHSPDARGTPAELCRQALAIGLTEIAITDHVEWEPNGRHLRPDYGRYFAELDACRDEFSPRGLTVLSGVELGNPHEHRGEVEELLGRYPFDVVIASLHWLDGENVHDTRCFVGRDPYDVYARYFGAMAEMAATVDAHLIAHFDRIFWPGTTLHGALNMGRLAVPLRTALSAIEENGRVLELNTRFVAAQPGWNDSLVTVLCWYREEGGTRVAINSDAHTAAEIGRDFDVGKQLLAEAGHMSVWQRRAPVYAAPASKTEREAAPLIP
jgi:histidinol-phosphatase (PHP family)